MTKKVVVLIDGGYYDSLNYYLKRNRGKKLDIEKLSKKVVKDGIHIRTKFYHSYPYQSENPTREEKEKYRKAQRFFYTIGSKKNHEFCDVGRVRPKYFTCPECGTKFMKPQQKGVDVGLALDLVKMAKKRVADEFILISGDEDFAAAVELAQEELCNVIVYYASDNNYGIYGSQKLNYIASDRVRMDLDFLEECAMDEQTFK